MFAECLRFRVAAERGAEFQAHNRRWRDALARQDGYLGQQVLRHADDAETWLVIVRWRDRAALLAFPDETQRALDAAGQEISTLVQADHFEEVVAWPDAWQVTSPG
jgi:heme-degrading monooxygenase HmoA